MMGRQVGILILSCSMSGREFLIFPIRPYTGLARSSPEPSPEQFDGPVRRSRSREFVRSCGRRLNLLERRLVESLATVVIPFDDCVFFVSSLHRAQFSSRLSE